MKQAVGASDRRRGVLIVEDEPRLRTMLARAIPDMGFEPITAGSAEQALDRAWRRRLDGAGGAGDSEAPAPGACPAPAQPPRTLQDHERVHIMEALERHDGNRAATAADLGISLRTLYYRLAQYGVHPEGEEPDA